MENECTTFPKMGLNLDCIKYLPREVHERMSYKWGRIFRICFQNSIKARIRMLPETIWIHKHWLIHCVSGTARCWDYRVEPQRSQSCHLTMVLCGKHYKWGNEQNAQKRECIFSHIVKYSLCDLTWFLSPCLAQESIHIIPRQCSFLPS